MRQKVFEKLRQLELLQAFIGRAAQGQAPADIPRLVKDPALLLRGNPEHPEHDARGFRNRAVVQGAELAVIGDSQVYGACVRAEQCWPFRLDAELSGGKGSAVYNAGLDGWGSAQYALAAEELLPLGPKRMLVCLYLGNDMAEAFQCAKVSTAPLARSFWEPAWDGLPLADLSAKDRAERAMAEFSALHPELAHEDVLSLLAQRVEPDVTPCAIEGSRFYLTERFRLAVQDLAQPAVAQGLAITRKVLAHLRSLSLNYGFSLGVMLIPTREYLVYLRRGETVLPDHQALDALGAAEARMHAELSDACAELGLPCFELAGHLKHFIGGRIYPQNSRDGHPNAKGCELIARYVKDRVLPGLGPSRGESGGLYPMY